MYERVTGGRDSGRSVTLQISRRTALSMGAVLGLLAGRPGMALSAGSGAASADVASHIRRLLEEIFGDGAAPRALGEAYLESHPHERSAGVLIREILGGQAPTDAPALARLVAARRTREFGTSQTIVLDGWVLTRSEARLCALTVLL